MCFECIFVYEDVYDDFLNKVIFKMKSLIVGDLFDENIDYGVIIN